MPAAPIHTNSARIGTCPHGLPPGACPVCSGMGGGNSTTKRDIPRNPGEMTYNQCAAIGAMIRAQKNAQKQMLQAQQNRLTALQNFQKTMNLAHQKLTEFAKMIEKSLPAIISKPVNFVINQIIARTLTLITNIPAAIANFTQNVIQKLADITSKLTAVYGELKSAISKTISENFSKLKKKLKSIFFLSEADETEDLENEKKKIDETKKLFTLKTVIQKLKQKIKKDS